MTNSVGWTDLDHKAVDTIRVLAADAVQKVGNGHPGTAISLAPAAYLIFQNHLRHDPADPEWLGRDRFVLSAGHSSLTHYLQLYMSGYEGMELEDIEALRTYGSQTPGHPEAGHTPGIEVTSGPLGQGVAMGIGLAAAQRRVRGLLDPDAPAGESPFDHNIYIIGGDGCMQEGVSGEASSFAGTQGLGNVCLIWDDNHISIEHETEIAFTEDVCKRYEAYGWHVQRVDWLSKDGEYKEDVDALNAAIEAAKKVTDKPSFIALRTIIGWPSPTKQNTGGVHGSALGDEEVAGLKKAVGFDPEKKFDVDPAALAKAREVKDRGKQARAEWQKGFDAWAEKNAEGKKLLDRLVKRELPDGWEKALPTFEAGKAVATRVASGEVLTALADTLPELWGGSADLAGSNNTAMKGAPSFLPHEMKTHSWEGNQYGRNIHFGVREFAMGAICNGIAMNGLTRPYGGTFLVFSDYMRNAVRVGALMKAPATYVWTHDSIGLGEDGPTHQPVEHLMSLRAIPGLDIVRPADATETAWAWKTILENTDRPAGIILSRQNLSNPERGDGDASGDTLASAAGVAKGGYVLAEGEDVILIATGSEVEIALEARKRLAERGVSARVVSMPCFEWFDEQDQAYRESVLPPAVKARVSVEAGVSMGWHGMVGDAGRCVSLEHYGASADGKLLFEKFGITAEAVVAAAQESVQAAKSGNAGPASKAGVPIFGAPADEGEAQSK